MTTTRETILTLLDILGLPIEVQVVGTLYEAWFGEPISDDTFHQIRCDDMERSADDPAPRIGFAIDAEGFGYPSLMVRSDWPLEQRIIPFSPDALRRASLRRMYRLCTLADEEPGAADPVLLATLLRSQAQELGLPDDGNADRWATLAEEAFAPYAQHDAEQRRIAAARLSTEVWSVQVFGRNPLINGRHHDEEALRESNTRWADVVSSGTFWNPYRAAEAPTGYAFLPLTERQRFLRDRVMPVPVELNILAKLVRSPNATDTGVSAPTNDAERPRHEL